MQVNNTSFWLTRVALFVVFFCRRNGLVRRGSSAATG
jgi:hypothetical protein